MALFWGIFEAKVERAARRQRFGVPDRTILIIINSSILIISQDLFDAHFNYRLIANWLTTPVISYNVFHRVFISRNKMGSLQQNIELVLKLQNPQPYGTIAHTSIKIKINRQFWQLNPDHLWSQRKLWQEMFYAQSYLAFHHKKITRNFFNAKFLWLMPIDGVNILTF